MNPSARLRMIASLVPPCRLAADIGADHGKLGAALLRDNAAESVLITDISAFSLQKARVLFRRLGLGCRVRFCLGDGLAAYRPEVPGAVVIAGMGAETIVGILERGGDALGDAALILSPMVGIEAVRGFLDDRGYRIEEERIVRSGRRWALGLRARYGHGGPCLDARQRLLGPVFLDHPCAAWRAWAAWRVDVLERASASALRARDERRHGEFAVPLSLYREAAFGG